jgi:hypothetical protein
MSGMFVIHDYRHMKGLRSEELSVESLQNATYQPVSAILNEELLGTAFLPAEQYRNENPVHKRQAVPAFAPEDESLHSGQPDVERKKELVLV